MADDLAGIWSARWQAWLPPQACPDLKLFLVEHDSEVLSKKHAVLLQDQLFRWHTPHPLSVEGYLQEVPELSNDLERVLQLVVGEFRSRLGSDTAVSIDEYTLRFSHLGDSLRSRLQAIDQYPTINASSSSPNEIVYIGRYRQLRLLGEGAFGFVWLGLDEELKRRVAIKVPKPERFRGPEDAEQYLSEARVVAGLDHPHIVPVYDIGRTENGSIYVVSKFIEGCALDERLRQQKLSYQEITKLLVSVAQALHHAHEQRLIHRDVKPANILIEDRTGITYVTDFGLAIREEDYLRDSRLAGTPAYMSPEQARGEGHRLDGRSDIFSLGVIMYEMLTGKRPFRGSTNNELLHQVVSVEPVAPRTLDDTVPVELDRICLRALSKRAADRYPSSNEFADDLSHWEQGPSVSDGEQRIVPKGLRSFDADDAEFFLDLLPGPRDRDGLPESIRFWKKRIEEIDPDRTFSVGLIYGPSGCGKSSLVKAGLLPRLSKDISAIYIEATPEETETRILRALRKKNDDLPYELTLPETFAWLRRQGGAKTVVILDQFEQWLHSHRSEQETDLVKAIRQCDGGRVQVIAMVRDDFAMAAARFMDSLEVPILQGENFATVDLFDFDHAKKVLVKFGRAFGKLPPANGNLSEDQQAFISSVTSGLASDGKVVSVRLSLFAEMIKGKPWTLQTLTDIGGTEGIGVNFLEDTFSSRNANPQHRFHEQAARSVLKSLLPEVTTDIKGHMRSHADLLADSGYESRPADFNTLLRILDGELRLITPTDPQGDSLSGSSRDSSLASRFYQLSHDYMVPSLREWLTRKQQETQSGRAELKLAERTNLWAAKPENRYLPSIAEWAAIRRWTDRAEWSPQQLAMMQRANRVHGFRFAMAFIMSMLLVSSSLWLKSRVDIGQMRTTSQGLVTALLSAETRDVPRLVAGLMPYREWADVALQKALSSTDAKTQLHARIALLPVDNEQVAPLQAALLDAAPETVMVLRDALLEHKNDIAESYWKILESTDDSTPQQRLAAGATLAKFSPEDDRWTSAASSVSRLLVNENPLLLTTWIEAFRPVRASLVPELGRIFRDRSESVSPTQRDIATNLLESYTADNVEQLAELIVDAEPTQFVALFDELKVHGDAAIEIMLAILSKDPIRPSLWSGTNVVSLAEKPVSQEVRGKVDTAYGIVTEDFVVAQTLKLHQFMTLAEVLGHSGYRPIRLRPYSSRAMKPNPVSISNVSELLAAAVWRRDGREWRTAIDQSKEELQNLHDQMQIDGFEAIDVAGYLSIRDGTPAEQFSAVWLKTEDDRERSQLYVGVTEEVHKVAFADLDKAGYKLQKCLHVFRGLDGKPCFSAVKMKQDFAWNTVWERTIASYREISYLDRPQWDVCAYLGSASDSPSEKRESVVSEATAALAKSPNSQYDRLRRGVALFGQSKISESKIDFEALIDADPTLEEAYIYRVLCNSRLGNQVAAYEDLAKLNSFSIGPASLAYTTAIVQASFGKLEQAETTLTEFAKATPLERGGLGCLAGAYAVIAVISTPKDEARSTTCEKNAIRFLGAAIAAGETDTEKILNEPDFDRLQKNPTFQSLINKDNADLKYAAVWNQTPGIESRSLNGLSPSEHRTAMLQLEKEGFSPVSLSALVPDNQEPISASVWQRREIPALTKENWATKQANAAATLVRLGLREAIFKTLRIQDDPESLTQFVHRCRRLGVTAGQLWECVEIIEPLRQLLDGDSRRIEDRVLFGLLLSLGEFKLDELSVEQRKGALDEVSAWFSDDPSSAIHGASGWLLKRWGQMDVVKRIDQTPIPYDPNREWFTLVIEAGNKQFFQTYVVISPGEYEVGSSFDERGRENDETRNRVQLTRTVAVLDREVTRDEFETSGVANLNASQYGKHSITYDHPMVAPSWYDSVLYCRWLTKQAGFSEADQVYVDPSSLDKEEYPLESETGLPKNWPLDLNKPGFRLPTEAEWEIAARGGMRSSFGFGSDEKLLDRYAWCDTNSNDQTHIAKELRPNLRGLFDMHGSATEWCQDEFQVYDVGKVRIDPMILGVDATLRVFRGGSWDRNPKYCRSAIRVTGGAIDNLLNTSFRVVLYPVVK